MALNNASADPSTAKKPISVTAKSDLSSFCTSAKHLLNTMTREGLRAGDLDPDCQAYLSRARPAVQTQVRSSSLFELLVGLPAWLQCLESCCSAAGSPGLFGSLAYRQDQKRLCLLDRLVDQSLQEPCVVGSGCVAFHGCSSKHQSTGKTSTLISCTCAEHCSSQVQTRWAELGSDQTHQPS